MSSALLLSLVIVYFLVLLGVAWYTSRNANNDSFYIGNRNSNWMLVAFGMIGTSLSGVTFVSVPGTVGSNSFGYFQVVIGYFLGYFIVAYLLLPLYYRLQLTSIYNYLLNRFGSTAYKTGALFFVISRTLGATARLYLVINVLQIFILNNMNIPFWVTTLIILFMILMYTFKGGVKTIVFTDTLQTTFMLLGLVVCIIFIMQSLHLSLPSAIHLLQQKGYTKTINTDVKSATFWLKQIIGGAFITVGMTGLDQEMMQKNISVRTLKDSQKNMMTFSSVMVVVNVLFLFLGGLLYLFAAQHKITTVGDDLFPAIALSTNAVSPFFPAFVSIVFIIGLISALFPSADGAITALTSTFCIDIIGLKRAKNRTEQQQKNIRLLVHFSFTILFFLCVLVFKQINSKSIINNIMSIAGYTYGPLLGLFSFGIFTRRVIANRVLTVVVCLVAPAFCYLLSLYASKLWLLFSINTPVLCYLLGSHIADWFNGYKIGIELLIINGLLTFLGLFIISDKERKVAN